MSLLEIIRYRPLLSFLKPQIPSNWLRPNPHRWNSSIFFKSSELLLLSSVNWRLFSFLAQSELKHFEIPEENSREAEKPSPVFFKEGIGLSETINFLDIKPERVCEKTDGLSDESRNREDEVRNLKVGKNEIKDEIWWSKSGTGNFDSQKGVKKNLWALFTDKKMKKVVNLARPNDSGKDQFIPRRLSSDMKMFAFHLYRKGYFEGASFMPENVFSLACFEANYGRQFLKFVAVEFGKDHQEIAKWLSAVDLKKVALFGCPNLGYKTIDAAKNLRKFFEVEEHKVCENCRMKESCRRANRSAGKGGAKIGLHDVMRILVLYSMDSVPWQLARHKEIDYSVSRLLKQVIHLST